ncbi:6-bladed beta-propeller [Sphaerotilus mobilis]|uniref:6-bladed beta-propeller n=1 Tax=Sphaerotilus mobilis TaxID=47994 RepID=UPI001F5FAB45|nr:6-bladed beta-propeller [Sphaerotilus mobilis]
MHVVVLMTQIKTPHTRWPASSRRTCLTTLGHALALGAVAPLAGCMLPPKAPVAAGPATLPVFPPAPDEPRFHFERSIRSSADILPGSQASELRRFVTGEQVVGEPLAKPYAVAVWRGRIYVSDTVARHVRVFDVGAGQHHRIGEEDGEGQLVKPIGLDVDAAGRLYVADIGTRTIQVYGPDRRFLRRIGGAGWFSRLTSVTVDAAGERVYAVDIGGVGSELHRVRVFDARSGAHLQDIGRRGSGEGEFNLPRDIAIGRDGRLYVVDGGNFRVVVFDAQGRYLRHFGSVGKQYGQFARPKEIATDRDGNVYVVDTAFGNFQIFDPDGALLLFVGERSERDAPARYMLPSGIAVDEDGRVVLVDQWFRKIDVYRPAALAAGAGLLAGPARPR